MKVKIFYPNVNGNIELTKKQLEELLEEAYNEGYKDGSNYKSVYTWTTSSPSITIDNGSSTKESKWWGDNTITTAYTSECVNMVNEDNFHTSPFVVEVHSSAVGE